MAQQPTYPKTGDAAHHAPREGTMTTMEQLRIQAIAWYTHLPRDYETAKLFINMLNDFNEWRLRKSSVVADEDFDAFVAQSHRARPKAKLKLVK
jgi:hypothetical protein